MLLSLGVAVWAAMHLFVTLGAGPRRQIIDRIGLGPYKGLFALTIIGAIVLIVLGWKALGSASLYLPPAGMRHATMALMPLAVILFISARAPCDLRRLIRHPQLTGVKLWAVAHLLSNGEIRSVILFGGLLAWAVAEVIVLNRRDGPWQKPAAHGALKTTVSVMIGLALTAALMFAHPWIAGVRILPGG